MELAGAAQPSRIKAFADFRVRPADGPFDGLLERRSSPINRCKECDPPMTLDFARTPAIDAAEQRPIFMTQL